MLLTIGIPTYNRISSLKNVILEIELQLSSLDGTFEVEVLISDNASNDGTYDFFKNNIFPPNFIYHRQPQNVGFDRNVNSLFEYATGKYLWTLSDDDNISGNSIQIICNELSNHNYVRFAYVNYNVFQNQKHYPSSCPITKGPYVIDSVKLLNYVKFSNTLISSCIFEVNYWKVFNPEKYFDTAWIHLYMARDMLLEGKSLVIGDVLVEMLQSDLKGSRKERSKVDNIEFYFYAHLKIVEFCGTLSSYGYPVDQEKAAIKFCKMGDISHIINYKLTAKSYNIKEIGKIIERMFFFRSSSVKFYITFIPLMLSPNFIFKLAHAIKKYFQRNSK
jgi:glycosyltransferase involved in cell wall biosynthesis